MRKCENCGANLDSGERCDCERESDRASAISTMRVADGLLRECGIIPCATLDYDYDIMDRTYGRHIQFLSGKGAFERITREKWKEEPVGDGYIRASTVYRGLKVIELQREGEKQ